MPSATTTSGEKRFVFGIVEHFVNSRDYVSLIGKLDCSGAHWIMLSSGLIAFAPSPPEGTVAGTLSTNAADGRFAGRIFKRVGHTGHLFVNH